MEQLTISGYLLLLAVYCCIMFSCYFTELSHTCMQSPPSTYLMNNKSVMTQHPDVHVVHDLQKFQKLME